MRRFGFGIGGRNLRAALLGASLILTVAPWATTVTHNDGQNVEKLIKQLNDSRHPGKQITAAEDLGRSNDVRAIGPLVETLDASWEPLRVHAALALVSLSNQHILDAQADQQKVEKIIDVLIQVWSTKNGGGLYGEAAKALGAMGTRAVDPIISAIRGNPNSFVITWNGAKALGDIGDPRAVAPLIELFKSTPTPLEQQLHEESSVAVQARMSLVKIGIPSVAPLVDALHDANPAVRTNSVKALAEIGDPRVVEPMIAILRDPDAEARTQAAFALGGIEDNRIVEPLKSATQDPDPSVRSAAGASLLKKGIILEIGHDDRFTAFNNGIVLDTLKNLMWADQDNRQDIDYEHAETYCANFRAGGYSDWRMPYQDEIASLFDPTKSQAVTTNDWRGKRETVIHIATDLIHFGYPSALAAVRPEPGLIGVIGIPTFSFESGEAKQAFACGAWCGRILPVRSLRPSDSKMISPGHPLVFDK